MLAIKMSGVHARVVVVIVVNASVLAGFTIRASFMSFLYVPNKRRNE